MGKFCQVCQKGTISGNKVSHSNRKSRKKWAPNTQKVRINDMGTTRSLYICTRCLRSGKVERA
ncbi:MAG: 50S ribosomal protein L28 [Christensenellales bacterium]